MINIEDFKTFYPTCKDPEDWVNAFNEVLPKYKINTPERVAAFIAQCGHESAGWRVFEENLNYSYKGLQTVFAKYFKEVDAMDYHRKPEKIANYVYANRMGNGNEQTGDGWKYRGRGPIQLTGYDNYLKFGLDMGLNAVKNPDLVLYSKKVSLLSAVWYWNTRSLNLYADKGDFVTLTKKINGGYNGLEDRLKHYNELIEKLGGSKINKLDDKTEYTDGDIKGTLRLGSRGEEVKIVQKALGIKADGIFGPGTEQRVKTFQQEHGLVPDGVVGPNTIEMLI